ncbi:protein FAM161A isoform X2 [Ostrinia furnacalis]|uniref:protein FAM161A isoform X2 n=1 Tax=Ostrinia furnacalis TaxID=93504 RepID=UPI001038EFBF|nr:protein FAM161A isoform X2 [Ostrinia furnacalis]
MTHRCSVFKNSCLRLPVDPISKMPKTAYERKNKPVLDQCSINSPSTVCSGSPDVDAEKLKDFYRSIPDYNDINHLPEEEFYFTLRSLREKKKKMLNEAVDHIDDNGFDNKITEDIFAKTEDTCFLPPAVTSKKTKSKINSNLRQHYCGEKKDTTKTVSATTSSMKKSTKKTTIKDLEKSMLEDIKVTSIKGSSMKERPQAERQKRNHSACSITWNDATLERNEVVDHKFDQFFDGKKYSPVSMDDEFKTQSMPSSPLRSRRAASPVRRKNITIPKPFKMTERRAFTKINSEAELRAQMKPFSFTKREEKGLPGMCDRAIHALPKSKKKKKFRARPVPKNLFSNYFYDKVKEDEFFRSMNRRIRAEEMLRASNYPGTMAARDRSRLSTPAAHSDFPIDPSPAVPSSTSSDRRPSSPMKCRRKEKCAKEDLITTSPQPFQFTTADRAAKKMQEVANKVYQESKCTESVGDSAAAGTVGARAYSALDLRVAASGRSNLAALLRAEAVRRKFEMESARRLADQRRRMEMRHRDRLLRSKPAWHLVKNNHEEDIAMRLQTRRDEEKMRREEFLHEMELMYGRVQQQPMLFERYYAPRPHYLPSEMLELSPRKTNKKRSSKSKSYHYNSPNRSRKVSINDTAETFNGDLSEYLNRVDDDKYSDSEVALDSLDGKR